MSESCVAMAERETLRSLVDRLNDEVNSHNKRIAELEAKVERLNREVQPSR